MSVFSPHDEALQHGDALSHDGAAVPCAHAALCFRHSRDKCLHKGVERIADGLCCICAI